MSTPPSKPRRIGINLCSIRPNQLSGPSIYAERITDKLLDFQNFEWVIYCHTGMSIPQKWTNSARIRRVITTVRRPVRIAFEQMVLPFLTKVDGIDLLFSPNFVSPLWGAKRLVATIHDMYYRVVPEVLPPWQRRYWQALIPLTAKHCDGLLAVSRSTLRDINFYLPGIGRKIRVTPLASAIIDKFVPGQQVTGVNPGYVLWVANVVGSKNPHAVTAAARILGDLGCDIDIVHVGSDQHNLLDDAIRADGCADRIKRLGRVSSAELRWLYRNALCVIQPSSYEGFGIPILEAQEFGSPLISSNASSLPEVGGDGALYFSPEKYEDLAELIVKISRDPVLRAQLTAKGTENAARFTWDKTAGDTAAFFDHLLNK